LFGLLETLIEPLGLGCPSFSLRLRRHRHRFVSRRTGIRWLPIFPQHVWLELEGAVDGGGGRRD
jgi:hypothetical protein